MDNYDQIIRDVSSPEFVLNGENSFRIAGIVGALLLNSDTKICDIGRRILIRILDRWSELPDETKNIWIELLLKAGFYPYIQKENLIKELPFFERVEQESYSSDNQDLYYHKMQKQIYDILLKRKTNLLVSAPTSFGKSFLIEEIVASKHYKNILIIQPTLALLNETRQKLQKYSDSYNIIVRTTQNADLEGRNLFLLTAERVLEYNDMPKIDFFVLDEFYKISNAFEDDRRDILNVAVFKVLNSYNPQFYFIGPYIEKVSQEFLDKYEAKFLYLNYSLVDVDTFLLETPQKVQNHETDYIYARVASALNTIKNKGQTIFYCSSPDMTFKVAQIIYDILQTELHQVNLPLVEWIRKNISQNWSFNVLLNNGIGVHNASLPKHITNSIISYFNSGKLQYLVCTSTIIEGVNTSAKNVVIINPKKSKNNLTVFDYKNIKGRAGRLMQHYVGSFYSFKEEPNDVISDVDIPFVDQEQPFSADIMIHMPDELIKDKSTEDYNFIQSLPIYNRLVYKQNGLSVRAQHELYLRLKNEFNLIPYKRLMYWKNSIFPTREELTYIFDRCWEHFGPTSKDHGIWDANHLVRCILSYRGWQSFHTLRLSLQNRKVTEDMAIRDAFMIINFWFQYKVPKWLTTFNEIQKIVAQEAGEEAANYSTFASMIEQDFLSNSSSVLLEYGIPASAINKIQHFLPENITENEIINWLRTNQQSLFSSGVLLDYEKEKIYELIS